MELTVAAIPFYFGSMGAEYAWQRRHAAERGPAPGDYEWHDTIASLTMGVGSLVAPLVAQKLLGPVTPGKGRYAKALLAIAAGGVAVSAIADVVTRRAGSDPAGEVPAGDVPRPEPEQANRAERRRRAREAAGSAAVAAVVAGGIAITTSWATYTTADKLWGKRGGRNVGTGAAALAGAILVWDFIYYWNHRFMHESRYMWAVHVVHHSSERYNLSTALRQPVADALGTFLPQGVLCLAGFPPSLISSARGINLIYQFWIHTEAIGRLGPLEKVLNTPSHHRVHHGVNPPVHRPQPRQHPDHLGQAVRHLRARRRARGLRIDAQHKDVQPSAHRRARASRDAERCPARTRMARAPLLRGARTRLGIPPPRATHRSRHNDCCCRLSNSGDPRAARQLDVRPG